MNNRFNFFFNFLSRNNQLHTFLLFFLISTLLWFVSQLGKTYEYELSVPVKYINLPEDVLNRNVISDSLQLKIQSGGFRILKYKILPPEITIDFKQINLINKYTWQPGNYTGLINAQLGNEQKIINIRPKTIRIEKEDKQKKMVPVAAKIEIHYKQGYKNTDKAQLSPGKIWLFGAAETLQNIDTVYTETYRLNQIDKDIHIQAALRIPEGIKTNIEKIDYRIPVDMFVEGTQIVKLRSINVPASHTLIPFPEKVKIKYKIFKKDFKRMHKDDFDVTIDYNSRFIQGKDTLLRAKPVKIPKEIIDYQIIPENIAFLLKKR